MRRAGRQLLRERASNKPPGEPFDDYVSDVFVWLLQGNQPAETESWGGSGARAGKPATACRASVNAGSYLGGVPTTGASGVQVNKLTQLGAGQDQLQCQSWTSRGQGRLLKHAHPASAPVSRFWAGIQAMCHDGNSTHFSSESRGVLDRSCILAGPKNRSDLEISK